MGSSSVLQTGIHRFEGQVEFVRINRLSQPKQWQLIHVYWPDVKKSEYPRIFQQNDIVEQKILQASRDCTIPLQSLIQLSQQIDMNYKQSLTMFGRITDQFDRVDSLSSQMTLLHRTFRSEYDDCQTQLSDLKSKLVGIENKLTRFQSARTSWR